MSTVLEGLRAYVSRCPELGEVKTDLADGWDGSCALVEKSEKTVRESITGGETRTAIFALQARLAMDSEKSRRDNHEKLERALETLAAMWAAGERPALPEGCEPVALRCRRGTVKRPENSGTAIYEIPMELTYEREGTRYG